MHPDPTYLPVPCVCPLPLQPPSPQKPNKISPSISTHKGSLLRVIASGFCYAINNGLSLGLLLDIPLSCVMCHRDSVVLDLHVGLSPSHAPTVHRCSGCWGGHLYPPGSGPGGGWVGQSAGFPSLSLPWQALQHHLSSSPRAVNSKKWGPWSGPQIWPTHTPPGSVLLSCPGEVLGPLSQLLQGYVGEGRSDLLLSHPQDWLLCAPQQQVSSSMLSRATEPALLSRWNSLKGTCPLSLGCVPIASG